MLRLCSDRRMDDGPTLPISCSCVEPPTALRSCGLFNDSTSNSTPGNSNEVIGWIRVKDKVLSKTALSNGALRRDLKLPRLTGSLNIYFRGNDKGTK